MTLLVGTFAATAAVACSMIRPFAPIADPVSVTSTSMLSSDDQLGLLQDPAVEASCARVQEISDLTDLLLSIPHVANASPSEEDDAAYAQTEAQRRSAGRGLAVGILEDR